MNPALANTSSYLSIPVIGKINVGVGTNFGVKDLIYQKKDGSGLTTFMNKEVSASSMLGNLESVNNAKRGRSYPAVLIGRLGVDEHFQGEGRFIGSQILDILKDWFTDENNKTGCRFMVVDAHNHPRTLHFYEQNGFKYLHKTENEEREYYHIPMDEPIHKRLMYCYNPLIEHAEALGRQSTYNLLIDFIELTYKYEVVFNTTSKLIMESNLKSGRS